MKLTHSDFPGWTPAQVEVAKRWVINWQLTATDLELIQRKELRDLDVFKALSLLCGDADYTIPPRAAKPDSGLVEQQRLFMKVRPK